MKINENSRISVPWPVQGRVAPEPPAPRERDGVSLRGRTEAQELARRLPEFENDAPDLERVAAVAARMKDGVFPASAEDVADAILDELSLVMAWLSDHKASQE